MSIVKEKISFFVLKVENFSISFLNYPNMYITSEPKNSCNRYLNGYYLDFLTSTVTTKPTDKDIQYDFE